MNVQDWASLATVLLCLEAFVVGLVALIVAYALGRAFSYVLREMPRVFVQVRTYSIRIHDSVALLSDIVAAPTMRVAGFVAGIQGVLRGIRRLVAFRS